ncbi:NAD(P)-dependent oxidoreductase [Streptomyces sp. NPDC031705]|uniref:NAD(P)-dependent oxidoreductase n=1 Tax=Streptomyces sp. NPDC031705 TaxID=3155729 RepID=UPI003403BAA7
MPHDPSGPETGPALPLAPGDVVTVLGAGLMASRIIPHIRRAGFRIRLHNRTRARLEGLAGPGTTLCATPREAARGARAVVSMVTDDEASRSVWLGADGALAGAPPGALAVECSTLSEPWTTAWAAACVERSLAPLDAPVTGSTARASDGTLVMFAGGSPDTIESARPLLSAFTEQVFRLGPTGAGGRFKLVNNMLAGSILVALGEAFAMAERLGLDPAQALEILSEFGWAGGVASGKGRAMLDDDHTDVGCRLALMAKDLGYATSLARRSGLSLPLASAAGGRLAEAVSAGLGDLDMSAVSRVCREAGR